MIRPPHCKTRRDGNVLWHAFHAGMLAIPSHAKSARDAQTSKRCEQIRTRNAHGEENGLNARLFPLDYMAKSNDKVALVTGGSRGIGAAIAKRLAQDGVGVAITYARDASAASAVVN
jgi:3-oxoacyl-ACP reductase-like protein